MAMNNTETIPPQDLDAEMALLGSMMMNAEVITDVIPIVSKHAFCLPEHTTIFGALVDFAETAEPIDLITFSDWLRARGEFDKVGGTDYLIQLAESFADWANAEYYARVVAEKHQRRELIRAGLELAHKAYDPLSVDVGEFTGTHIQRIERLLSDGHSDDDEIRAVLRRLPAQYVEKERSFVRTGLVGVDEKHGGLERGSMTILAGTPSAGKTALSMWFALQAAAASVNTLFVSAEMRQTHVALRVLSALSGVQHNVLRYQSTQESIAAEIEPAISRIGPGHVYLRDDLNNARDIVSSAKAYVRKHAVQLVVIDYLQLCEAGGRSETRNLAVGDMAKAFKQLAHKTGAAVLVLSQLNRSVAKEKRAPELCDLRDSGEIEQHADVVIFLHRISGESNTDSADTEFRIAKYRNGQVGRQVIRFNKPRMTFSMGMQHDG